MKIYAQINDIESLRGKAYFDLYASARVKILQLLGNKKSNDDKNHIFITSSKNTNPKQFSILSLDFRSS